MMSGSASSIRAYLAERQAAATRGLPRGRGAQLLRTLSTPQLRFWTKVNGTLLLTPVTKRRIRALLASGEPIRLNLGSGSRRIEGWVNLDIVGMGPHLHWDLRRGIPFPDASVDAAFLEHVLEHFPADESIQMLAEARRVLKPGGIARAGVPDFGRYLRSYAGDGEFIERLRPGRPTPLLAVAEVALQHGHRSVWDGETLSRAFEEAGFVDVQVRSFGDSDADPVPDTPMREPESVYVEGRAPAR